MPYHIHILRKKSLWDRDTYIFDLSRTELIDNIVDKYHKAKEFMVGGTVIDPTDISRIEIVETGKDSSHFINNAKAKKTAEKSSKVVVLPPIPLDYYIFKEISNNGKDVTNQFIKHPPKKRSHEEKKKKIDKSSIYKALTGIFVSLLVFQIVYFVYIPWSNQPSVRAVMQYDSGTKVFPDILSFSYDPEFDNYTSSIVFYLSKIGKEPATLYIKIKDSTDFLNRFYTDKNFEKTSKRESLIDEKSTETFKFELQENLALDRFKIDIEFGMRYYIHPLFIPINIGPSYSAWCEYVRDIGHLYRWVDSSFSN